ncbi:MAG: dihydrofolate reductase family protein [Acidobacteriota bacterium]|nr:dihydrofolate reductase family protein [Acidobacteriota bacterium]
MDWATRLAAFVAHKTTAAVTARIPGYVTTESHGAGLGLRSITNAWASERFDGPFFESDAADPSLPAVNTVFVRSSDGNTGAENPMDLGGGLTDKHLIYEGLSSAHADAIITGASTIRGAQMIMAIWHPELVALRSTLGLDRYPAQVVATRSGDLDIESALLFNVPELRVFILTNDTGAEELAPHTRPRPWIRVVSGGRASDVIAGLKTLRADHGITRASCIGGRTLTTQLIDAGVVQDLYLTTSPKAGGEPNTPFYTGARPLNTALVVSKAGRDVETGVRFEHFRLADD